VAVFTEKSMSARLFRQLFLLCAALLIAGICRAEPGADLAAQRARFPLVWEAARHGPDLAWRKLAAGLEGYPLYPYLPLASMRRRMSDVRRTEVDKFLAAWPDSLPAQQLREDFLRELARRNDWKDFLDLYTPITAGIELPCDALHARIALGRPLDFNADVEPLWLSAKALPDACDAAVAWARAQGKLTPALIRQRIELAATAGHARLIATLAAMLDGNARQDALRLVAAIREPGATLSQAASWPDSASARAAATLALVRLARRDSDAALTRWPTLFPHLHFAAEQRDRILHAIAVYQASDYAPDAGQLLGALPAAANDDVSREWRVRVALAAQDWRSALAALDAMSDAQKADDRWRYLRARVLVKLGRADEAAPLFASAAREANFHGFLAADWLKLPYTICSTRIDADAAADTALRKDANLARAFEFFAIGRLPEARREWDFAIPRLDTSQRRRAAALASRKGWYDRAVYAFGKGEDLHLYDLRFPLARRAQVRHDARDAGIEPAWAFAIIRAESAWTADARSDADAWGLMQLLPGTARNLAKAGKISFSGAAALFDPELNIRLGVAYLSKMAERYDGSPWLASAAYNAGPDPVDSWIDARDTLAPDFFIETIPYKETRDYVARVLAFSVIYDWRLHGNVLPLASRLPRIGQAYTPPPADAPRKAVVCPATPTDAPAMPSSSSSAPPPVGH
jgi:soluble lytic murein transglycosylase